MIWRNMPILKHYISLYGKNLNEKRLPYRILIPSNARNQDFDIFSKKPTNPASDLLQSVTQKFPLDDCIIAIGLGAELNGKSKYSHRLVLITTEFQSKSEICRICIWFCISTLYSKIITTTPSKE